CPPLRSSGDQLHASARRSGHAFRTQRILPYGTLSVMAATVNVNGRVSDQEHASISVFDHGFLYGEGVYETLRTYNGQPFLCERHMRRLRTSASMLALPVPIGDQEIEARFRETMTAAGLAAGGPEAYVRILVTRGV